MVSLIPVTSMISNISVFSPEGYKFDPSHLHQTGKNLEYARETLFATLKMLPKFLIPI